MEAIEEVKDALTTLQTSVLDRISAVERETKEMKDQYDQAIVRANRPGLLGDKGGNSEREAEALGHAILVWRSAAGGRNAAGPGVGGGAYRRQRITGAAWHTSGPRVRPPAWPWSRAWRLGP